MRERCIIKWNRRRGVTLWLVVAGQDDSPSWGWEGMGWFQRGGKERAGRRLVRNLLRLASPAPEDEDGAERGAVFKCDWRRGGERPDAKGETGTMGRPVRVGEAL